MLPLGAGLEGLLASLDAVVDTLVIASLEMQRVVVTVAAPVTAVQRRVALVEDSRRDRTLVLLGKYDEDVIRQGGADTFEEGLVEVGQRAAQHE